MVSEMPDYSAALADITQVTRQLLRNGERRIVLLPEMDVEGNAFTRLEIDLLAKETHDVQRLSQLRAMLSIVFGSHPELGDVHLTFRANISTTLSGGGSLSFRPDVSDIRRMIESLP
jgi:hypothetical protein